MDQLQKVVSGFLADLGFGRATYHLARRDGYGDNLIAFMSDYPVEWLKRYANRNYVRTDLVHVRSRKTVIPFSWRDVQLGEIPKSSALIFDEATEYGIHDGFSVPIHGPGSFGVFSAVADGSLRERSDSLVRGYEALTVLALHVHERAQALLEHTIRKQMDMDPRLTPRETECLQWIAAGKTGSEVAIILNIAEATANHHIRSAMHKLNALTRAHAAVKAVLLGLVEPV